MFAFWAFNILFDTPLQMVLKKQSIETAFKCHE